MSKKGTKALASATLMSLVLTTALSAGPVKAAAGQVTRVGEADRYATAAKVATENWKNGAKDVVLVSGEGYADAVSASALAKKLNAPIILTTANSLNDDAIDAIEALKPTNIYVVGGNASVSASVRSELKNAEYNLVELQGKDRYETNVKVAEKLVELGVSADNVMLVGGEGFSDALSVAPVAAAKGQILLLGNNNSTSMKSVLDFVKANKSKVTVVGTSYVISDDMFKALGAVERVNGGANRFETNINVLNKFSSDLKADKLFVANATGDGYADALVASALAGKTASPLVLVDTETSAATSAALNYIKGKATKTTDLNVVGGTGVVSNNTVNAINNVVNPTNPNPGPGDTTVNSIETVGLNQIKVVFNTAVDEDTAEKMSNYQLDGVSLKDPVDQNTDGDHLDALDVCEGTATLQADKKTVLITLKTPVAQNKEVTVTVKDAILDKDLNTTVPKFEQKVTFSDTTIPTLDSVTVSGNNKLTVKFSKPVQLTLNDLKDFKVNGQSITNYGYDSTDAANNSIDNPSIIFNNGNKAATFYSDKVQLYFTSSLPVGTNTFKVPDGTTTKFVTAGGFQLKETEMSFTVDSVTDKPVVSNVTGDTNGKITITFNRPMDKATALVPGNYTVNTHVLGSTTAYTPSSIKFVDGSNDTQVEIKGVSAAVNAGGNTILVSNRVKDAYGNKIADDTNVNYTATKDETKPTVKSVTVVDSKTVRVKFSKDVDFNYGTNKSNYKLVDSTGLEIGNANYSVATATGKSSNTDSYEIKMNSGKELTGSKYTLTIKNVQDTSSPANVMDEYTTTFAGKDDIAPSFNAAVQKDTHKVVLFFSEAMDEATIKNPDNYYYINGKDTNTQKLPSSAVISPASDNKSVTIEFPSSFNIDHARANSDDSHVWEMGVANVKDVAGNLLSGIAKNLDITDATGAAVVDRPSFEAKTAKFVYDGDDLKVQIQLTVPLDTINKNDFTVQGQTPDNATISGKLVTLTFKDGNAAIATIKAAGVNATVNTVGTLNNATAPFATTSADASGRLLNEGLSQVVYYDQAAPRTVSANWRATDSTSATGDTVSITFDSPIDDGIKGAYTDDFVFTAGGTKLDVASVDVVGSTLIYHLDKGGASAFTSGDTINIHADSTKISIRTKKDLNGDYAVYAPSSDDLKVRSLSLALGLDAGCSATALNLKTSANTTLSAIVGTNAWVGATNTGNGTKALVVSNAGASAVAGDTVTFTATPAGGTAVNYVATFDGTNWTVVAQ